jgi:hypothetical protein
VLGRNLEGLVNRAMEAQAQMGDQFVSVEHLVLAMAEDSRFGEALLRGEGLGREQLLAAIKDIRGSNKVGGGCAAAASAAGPGPGPAAGGVPCGRVHLLLLLLLLRRLRPVAGVRWASGPAHLAPSLQLCPASTCRNTSCPPAFPPPIPHPPPARHR